MHWLKPRPDSYPDLDEAYLDRLALHLGEDTLIELLADGLIELGDQLSAAERYAEAGDHVGLAQTAHTLIGLAGHLGLSRLSLAAAGIEMKARAGEMPELSDFAEIARPALEALRARLQKA